MSLVIPILAALFSVLAYAWYAFAIFGAGVVPNPASWTVAFLASLNAISFWRGSRDALATAQFFAGSFGCFAIWVFPWFPGTLKGLIL